MKKFYEIYTSEELRNAMNNKYLVRFKYKLDKKVCISDKYGIVIRNINKIENDILSQSLASKIYRIISQFKNIDYIFDYEKTEEIKENYLKQFTDFNSLLIIPYDIDGYEQYSMFDKIVTIIKENIGSISSKDNNDISEKIANKYLENCIVLYSEKEELIYKLISSCTNYSKEDIDDFGRYDDFIFKYLELWNALNFSQQEYLGFTIETFTTRLETVIDLLQLENTSFFHEYDKALKNPFKVDLDDDTLFYFILNRFNADYYLDNNNKILLYFSLLELMLTHKQCDITDSISNQLSENITLCSKRYEQIDISKKEIKELYNYRSLLAHGNFKDIHKSLKKIKKFSFAKDLTKKLGFEEFEEIDYFTIDLVRIRVLEIFSYIYKIYCSDKAYIDGLKIGNKEQ